MKHLSFLSSSLASASLALSLLAGCGEHTTNTPVTTTGPVYALTTQLLTADTTTSYVLLTDKVDAAATLSLDKGLSVPGRALGVGIAKSGSIFVGNDEEAKLTRYTLSSAGTLQEDGQISFANKGVTAIGEYQNNFQFISATKAYYFDGASAQLIVWNPTDLTLTKTVDLSGLNIQGASLIFSPSPLRRDNQVLMPVGWRQGPTLVTKMAGVVAVDTTTDTVTLVKDDRCGYVHSSLLGTDGQVYLATEVYGAASHRVSSSNPAPCVLKFDPNTLKFDPSFYKDMNSLAGGAATGALLPGTQPGTAYVRVLDETVPSATSFNSARVLASGAGWQWWKVDLSTWTATKQDSFPATTGSAFLFQADGQTLYSEFAVGSTGTTLHLLGDNGKPTVTTDGLTFSFLQLR